MVQNRPLLIAPTRTSPPGGPIALGNIIKDPRSPEFPLTNINSAAVKSLAATHQDVEENNVTNHGAHNSSVGGGLVFKILEGVADLGLDLGGSYGGKSVYTYSIDRLVTQSIFPTMEEVTSIFNEPDVQAGIRKSYFYDNVYMITSVQIAYGADVFISDLKKAGAHLHLRADLTSATLPVNIGTMGSLENSDDRFQKAEVSATTPFVLAYRVRELSYIRKRIKAQKNYVEGDLSSVGRQEEVQVKDDEKEEDFMAELVTLKQEDPEIHGVWEMKPNEYLLVESDE